MNLPKVRFLPPFICVFFEMHRKVNLSYWSVCFLVFILVADKVSGQLTFQKTYSPTEGSIGKGGFLSSDGGVVMAGSYDDKIFLMKTDYKGDTLWTRTYDLGFGNWSIDQVRKSPDNDILIAGFVYDSTSFYLDAFYMTADSSGNLNWLKRYNNFSDDYGTDMLETPDGGYLLLGYGLQGAYFLTNLIKTDSAGTMQWVKRYQYTDHVAGSSIMPTNDNGYAITGMFSSMSIHKIFLMKTDSLGNVQWSRSFNEGYGVETIQLADSSFIVTGRTNQPGGFNYQTILIKVDVHGWAQWSKCYGSYLPEYLSDVILNNDSNLVLTGRCGPLGASDFFFLKLNLNGDTISTMHYGTPSDEVSAFVEQTSDGGYIFGGNSNSDLYLVKTDSLGNVNCNNVSVQVYPFTIPFGTALAPVQVYDPPFVNSWAPAFTQSQSAFQTTLCTTLENPRDAEPFSFEIFPNPTTGEFYIQFQHKISDGEIRITDMTGRLIQKSEFKNQIRTKWKLDNVVPGVYLVSILDIRKQSRFVSKLVIHE